MLNAAKTHKDALKGRRSIAFHGQKLLHAMVFPLSGGVIGFEILKNPENPLFIGRIR